VTSNAAEAQQFTQLVASVSCCGMVIARVRSLHRCHLTHRRSSPIRGRVDDRPYTVPFIHSDGSGTASRSAPSVPAVNGAPPGDASARPEMRKAHHVRDPVTVVGTVITTPSGAAWRFDLVRFRLASNSRCAPPSATGTRPHSSIGINCWAGSPSV
jgi:hypothetical protein